MHNMIYLIGRITNTELKIEDGDLYINVAVQRNYKNEDGIYETDFINCRLFGGIATNVVEYCQKGDLVGVRGRLESNNDKLSVVVDKISFLASKKD